MVQTTIYKKDDLMQGMCYSSEGGAYKANRKVRSQILGRAGAATTTSLERQEKKVLPESEGQLT